MTHKSLLVSVYLAASVCLASCRLIHMLFRLWFFLFDPPVKCMDIFYPKLFQPDHLTVLFTVFCHFMTCLVSSGNLSGCSPWSVALCPVKKNMIYRKLIEVWLFVAAMESKGSGFETNVPKAVCVCLTYT